MFVYNIVLRHRDCQHRLHSLIPRRITVYAILLYTPPRLMIMTDGMKRKSGACPTIDFQTLASASGHHWKMNFDDEDGHHLGRVHCIERKFTVDTTMVVTCRILMKIAPSR